MVRADTHKKYHYLPSINQLIPIYTVKEKGFEHLNVQDTEEALGRFLVLLNRKHGGTYFKNKSVLFLDNCNGYLGIVAAMLGADVLLVTIKDHQSVCRKNIEENKELVYQQGGRIFFSICEKENPGKFDMILVGNYFLILNKFNLLENLVTKNCYDGTVFLMANTRFVFFEKDGRTTDRWFNQHCFKVDTTKSVKIKECTLNSTEKKVTYYENDYKDEEIAFIKDNKIDLLWYYKDPTAIEAIHTDDEVNDEELGNEEYMVNDEELGNEDPVEMSDEFNDEA